MAASRGASVAVHLLTASGALCGLLSLHHTARADWQGAFAWLGAALIIDAIDGPLARRLDVQAALPRFSGARLDQVVDFLNYCVVPAFILQECGILSGWQSGVASGLVVLSSLFHFADRHSKTDDGYFVGFPAIWNVVCLYLFVFALTGWLALAGILVLVGLTFTPVKWVHPLRVERLRPLTVVIVCVWGIAAIWTVYNGFPGDAATQAIFAASAVYIVVLGLARTLGATSVPGR